MVSKKHLPSFTTEPRQRLPGSEKRAFHAAAERPATGTITVSVILRRKTKLNPRTLTKQRITRAEYARTYAADNADIAQIR